MVRGLPQRSLNRRSCHTLLGLGALPVPESARWSFCQQSRRENVTPNGVTVQGRSGRCRVTFSLR